MDIADARAPVAANAGDQLPWIELQGIGTADTAIERADLVIGVGNRAARGSGSKVKDILWPAMAVVDVGVRMPARKHFAGEISIEVVAGIGQI